MKSITIGLMYMIPFFIAVINSANNNKSDVHPPIDMKIVMLLMFVTAVMTILGLIYIIKGSYQVYG